MRCLLRLYPASFRREYGGEIRAQYAHRRAECTGIAVLALWVDTVFDTVGNAALVHWDVLRQDMHQALRHLRRTPGFVFTAVTVTALGIGANTAAFSVADLVFLRPLPFRAPDSLVTLWERVPSYSEMQPSPANYRDWQKMAQSFDQIGAYHNLSVSLLGGATPQQVTGAAIDGPLLDMLGVAPFVGHLPSAQEVAEGAPVVVLSYPLWQESFGGARDIVGRQVTVDGAPYTVAGVMPRSFVFPDRTVRIWAPMHPSEVNDPDRGNNWFYVVARLKPGHSVVQARRDMDRVAAQLRRMYPTDNADSGSTVLSLRDTYSSMSAAQGRTLLTALCGAALCVLLITCANLANLLLVRALVRRRELAVRAALGAGRERLIRQLLTESLMLATAGGVLGVGLAFVALPLLGQLVPATLPLAQVPSIDLRVLVAAAVLSLITGIGFGVMPAIRAGRTSSFDGLRDDTRSGGGRRAGLRSALVAVEVGASVVLLVSAGLLLRAMWRVRAVDPGFNVEQVMTLRTELPLYRYWKVASRDEFYQHVLGGVRALPGVQAAGYISFLPMKMGGGIWVVSVPPDTGFRHASLRFITPGYLAAMRIPLLRGRDVAESDTPAAPMGAVVSQSFAQRYWPGLDPIGRHFTFAFADRTVIGVVQDVRVRGPERISEPQVYLPYQQMQDSSVFFYAPKDLAIRSTLAPGALIPAVRRIVRDADPLQAVSDLQPMSAVVSAQTMSRTVQVRVLTVFAAIAFVLAGIGLHGLLAFAVSQRRQEIAIRMALGAEPGRILRLVARQSALLALTGIIAGVIAAYVAGEAMQGVLAGVDPADPLTFGAVALLVVAMVAAGTWFPARRAVSVAPASAMRAE